LQNAGSFKFTLMTLKYILASLGLYRPFVNYKYQPDENHIEMLNFWSPEPKNTWHYQFVTGHFSKLLSTHNSMLISSVFGPKRAIKLSKSKVKMFYTGENVARFPEYRDQCRSIADIVVGFDPIDDYNYQRFPIWLEYFFHPMAEKEAFDRGISQFVRKDICADPDKKFCALVSSHDKGDKRTLLFNSLSEVERVDSGGRFLNNTSALKDEFGDDKIQFIGQYKFNICPENSNREGYVTEKLFEAIRSNTIPIYWGSNNNPEPNVLNKDAILFYEGPDQLSSLKQQVKELHSRPKLYSEFLSQNRFQPHAAEYIADMFHGLYSKVHAALKQNP
jgi:hypothetical protein